MLDNSGGSGRVFHSILSPIFQLVMISLVSYHLLAGQAEKLRNAALTGMVVVAVFIGLQLSYEPNGGGQRSASPIMLFLLVVLGPAVAFRAWRSRAVLREKGYNWIGFSDAVFVGLNVLNPKRIPCREELATIPEYVEGDTESLCRVAMLRDEATRA